MNGAQGRRPRPEPDERSAPYWDAAARHQLTVARCRGCGTCSMPPDEVCPACGTTDPAEFVPVAGGGAVRSWTVVHRSFVPGFAVPFTLVDVELDDAPGVRLIGRLLDGADRDLRPGDRVRAAFEDLAPGVSVPAFTAAPGPAP